MSLIDLPATFLDLAGVPDEQRLPMDGSSLLRQLAEPEGQPDRTVFAEMHVEDVAVPCFMVRRGVYKYVSIHGIDCQLFNLAEDLGEWQNLAGDPAYQGVADELHGALLERFDPDAIDTQVRVSLQRRLLIASAMRSNDTRWGYRPAFDSNRDATSQYWRWEG